MAKLNDTEIGKLRWDASKRNQSGKVPQFQWESDTEIGGLHIRIYPPKANGQSNKVFYLKYGPDVDRKVYRIGTWGEWTLEASRAEARRVRKDFHHKGVDPNQAKKKKVQQAKAKLTVKELVDEYLDAHPVPVWSVSYASANKGISEGLKSDDQSAGFS